MHVGYGAVFKNPNNALPDAEVYRNELRLAEMAEPLGFDSIWGVVDHHFDDHTMFAPTCCNSSPTWPARRFLSLTDKIQCGARSI